MTLRVNSAFATQLNAAKTSNVNWSSAFKAGLGENRRVKCVRHANAATADDQVFALGTVFRDAALTGDMIINGGVITYYGATTGLTTALAADLATGKSVLRIEGNGNWIEGTLGLVGSNCDFVLPANPTTTNSIAVAANMRIKPPPFLPSGTGPTPPTLDANAPAFVIIENWTNPAAVVEAGRIPFNTRIENMVFEDSQVAAEMGDVRITQSTESVTLGEFIFGATMFSMNPVVNTVAGETLNQVLIGCRPTEANWPRYPRFGGYRRSTRLLAGAQRDYGLSNTFPSPFKAKICKADGTVLYTHQMRDGLPINSPDLSLAVTKTKPLRPQFHCGSMLPWESHKPKLSAKAKHYFPGLHAHAIRYSLGKEKAAFNQPYPLYQQAQPSNSSGHWHAMPKWPLACSVEALTADELTRTDPHLYSIGPNSAEFASWATRGWMKTYYGVPDADAGSLTYGSATYQGWGYEPGSHSGHDHFTGPGGVRIDRAIIPGPIAIHMTNPTWVHKRDNTPIEDMVSHWNNAYFNHEWHYLTDARTLESLPTTEVLAGAWGHCKTYYAGNDSYTPGGVEYAVPLFAGSGLTADTLPCDGAWSDANNRMPWNGSAIDYLHNYSMPGWVALLYNSPMHAYSQKLRYFGSIMAQLGSAPPKSSVLDAYATRKHAWVLGQAAMAWKLSASHPLAIPRADMEARIIGELTAVYESVTVPLNVENSQAPQFKMLRNFGVLTKYVSYEVNKWPTQSMGLTFYMAHVMQFWRQSGLWRKMYDHSAVTRDALLTIIQTLDVACFGFILETGAAYIGAGGSVFGGNPIFMVGGSEGTANPEVPTGWADWQARVWPKTGQENMIRNTAGALTKPISDEHLRMQWPFIRRDYFSDVPCVYNVTSACAIVDVWQNEWAAYVAAEEAVGPRSAARSEWTQPPGYGRILPPTLLEP